MEATLYVYAYLLLSFVYIAGCIAYLNAVTRTASLAKARQEPEGTDGAALRLETEEQRSDTQIAVRAVLAVDSAAFACAVIPVAYVAVSGLLGFLIARNTAAANLLNPLWLLATIGVVVAHGVFVARIASANSQIKATESATLSQAFVSRHTSMLTYYRVFLTAIALFAAANSVYLIANLDTVTSMPYVL